MGEEEPKCQLRRRRSSGNPNLPLNLEVGYKVNEGGPSQGTPSPSVIRYMPDTRNPSSSQAMLEFRKKQQSFDLEVTEEECDEEEIIIESDGEEEPEAEKDRPLTPIPIQDFGANVVYSEAVPQTKDYLKVAEMQNEVLTDVSDAESEEE